MRPLWPTWTARTRATPAPTPTTLADLVALANSNPAFAQVFAVAVLSDVASSDPTTSVAQIEARDSAALGRRPRWRELLGAEQVDSGTTIGQLIDEIASDDPSAFNGLFLGDLLAGLVPESSFPVARREPRDTRAGRGLHRRR